MIFSHCAKYHRVTNSKLLTEPAAEAMALSSWNESGLVLPGLVSETCILQCPRIRTQLHNSKAIIVNFLLSTFFLPDANSVILVLDHTLFLVEGEHPSTFASIVLQTISSCFRWIVAFQQCNFDLPHSGTGCGSNRNGNCSCCIWSSSFNIHCKKNNMTENFSLKALI